MPLLFQPEKRLKEKVMPEQALYQPYKMNFLIVPCNPLFFDIKDSIYFISCK